MDDLTCGRCGDAVTTVDQQHNGPCCHNLPQPWHRGEDGLYNQPTDPSAYYEDEDHVPEEEEEEPCQHENIHTWCDDCEARLD